MNVAENGVTQVGLIKTGLKPLENKFLIYSFILA